MASNRPPGSMGLDLRGKGLRPCGLCGQVRKMTKAHVPPQTAGNSEKVTSGIVRLSNGVRGPGRQASGGMWLRGLCEPCNNLAGRRYDLAYGEFAKSLIRHARFGNRLHLTRPWEPPPVGVAPGLVSRSVLFGFFAISPNLRVIFPELASDLRVERDHIAIPEGLTLRFAILPERRVRIAGPMSAHRVLTVREDFDTFGEIFFRPLAWVLAPTSSVESRFGNVSRLDREGWASADEWLQYGSDVVNVDLRNLVRRVPVVQHPYSIGRDEWIELFSDEITPVLEGEIPA